MKTDQSVITTELTPLFDAYNAILGGSENKFRPSQLQFMVTCYEAAANGLPAVVEGPTGLGKTKALLTVATAYMETHADSRVLYATRTMPQLQNVEKDLRAIASRLPSQGSATGNGSFFGVYIGIGSLRRLLCQRFLDGITMDEQELDYLRSISDDPERLEPCPDCPIRDSRRRLISEDDMGNTGNCGLQEMATCLDRRQCPVPFMRVLARKASFVLTTYPYLLDDYWKTTILGRAETRSHCLPIIDEAHNMVEMVTKSPALSLHLTSDVESGRGMDTTANVYYLASLVEDLRYGYKRAVLGHLGALFEHDKKSRDLQRRDLINQTDSLRKQRNRLQVEAQEIHEAFGHFIKALPKLKAGENPDLPHDLPWAAQVHHAQTIFSSAASLSAETGRLMREHGAVCAKHKQLCQEVSALKRRRDALQTEAKKHRELRGVSTGTARQTHHTDAMNKQQEASDIHEAMVALARAVDPLSANIEQLAKTAKAAEVEQKKAYRQAQQIVQQIFDDRQKDAEKRKNGIALLSDQIEVMQAEINRLSERAHATLQAWSELREAINHEEIAEDTFQRFYDSVGISKQPGPLAVLRRAFSLFDFLVAFRLAFQQLLTGTPQGPIRDAALSSLLRELDRRLVAEGGASIETFLTRCEGAIAEFESNTLNTESNWDGKPLYGLRQMFRIVWRICSVPYGFAAFLDKEKGSPSISFHSLDPAERFKDVWHDLRPPILASATISPVSDVAEVLGLDKGILAKIDPVFPVHNYMSFAFLGIHSAGQNVDAPVLSHAEEAILESTIGPILTKTHVHTGLYCASYRVLDHVAKVITKEYVARHGMYLLVARSDREPVRDHFDQLRSQVDQTALKGLGDFDARLRVYQELAGKTPIVLCGVTGGGLGEGVDFRGELMELAIIIGIPYEGEGDTGWLNNLRTALFKMRKGNEEIGKDLAYRQSALRKVAQTAGRVHRTVEDRGAVVFFDERLLGLKNTGEAGMVSHEFLNPDNARTHWEIIQTRIFQSLRVVVPPTMTESSHDIQSHAMRVFRRDPSPPEIIRFPTMLNLLSEFYA